MVKCIVDNHHGVYIPQQFIQANVCDYDGKEWTVNPLWCEKWHISVEDAEMLLKDPNGMDYAEIGYWETWETVESNAHIYEVEMDHLITQGFYADKPTVHFKRWVLIDGPCGDLFMWDGVPSADDFTEEDGYQDEND
jgi:hypothetical protein